MGKAETTEELESTSQKKDCLGCRITGSVVCLGVSGYLASHLLANPPPVGMHRSSIILFAGGFFCLSVFRALT